MNTRPAVRATTPIDIVRNNRGKVVSIELRNGQVVNGTVVRSDRTMNMVLRDSIRTGADGNTFWRCRECFVRGASIKNIRMDASALRFSGGANAKKATGKRNPTKDRRHHPKKV
ncbi:U6 snRNA-associated Sm-like protein LSm4 [Angomonas deanei]|uniref:U6 snRNA-associated Sm-like protein LSm4 n=1 Tax=Angomonas deanei TaxID=59799 RepID=A0A7G2CAA6_9TRYP|nr:U6 snRNA-associated Sm-like protein LSm4 [Angomonas deanei]CAD2216375.1 LSM domain containing protein, putative [Angomonas deanei]|eukprot:EPY43686.1 U6 snRNA-associated Sm-like protein LSm4 [Angomonas deanei]